MGWRGRVLHGRVRDQATVLATVATVTLVATTLLGTFAFLLHVTGEDAVDEAMARLPEDAVAVESVVRVRLADVPAALEAVDQVVTTTLGDVPVRRDVWLTGRLWNLPRTEDTPVAPLVYPAAVPGIEGRGELVAGVWPQAARDDAGRLAVNVPALAAERFGWTVGSQVQVGTVGRQLTDTWVVVGTHRLTGATSTWSRDLLQGASYVSDYPVPGTMGMQTTEAWGPAVVAPDALLGPALVDKANVVVVPDLSAAGPGGLARVREELDSTQVRLSSALREVDVSGHVVTALPATIDAAWRELAVTRIGVVVVGLLLAVLATTVMLLAARLLAERRASEGELVAARGASPGQIRSLATLEAGTLAVATAAVAPWLARGVAVLLTRYGGLAEAGVDVPAGVPLSVYLACAGVALALAVALVVPSWHTQGSSTASAHAGLVRAGADVALVALGAVALWQLLDHGAPLTRGAGGVRIDPVLTVGPALVTLACAVLALRLVTPVGRGADALARRSTSLVAPLAAWQVARRPVVAAGTTLVVVLAVTTATFAHSFGTTWRTSQLEQVDLALGTDGRVDGARDERITLSADARAAFADAPADASLQPVADRTIRVGRSIDGTWTSGVEAHLVAVDSAHGDALRGRTPLPWPEVVEHLGPKTPTDEGTALPGEPQWLVADVLADTTPFAPGVVYLTLAVQDAAGVTAWLSGPSIDIGGTTSVALQVPRARGPLRIVAANLVVATDSVPTDALDPRNPQGRRGVVSVALQDLRVVDRSVGAQDEIAATTAAADAGTPVTFDLTGWDGRASSGGIEREATFGAEATTPSDTTPGAFVVAGAIDLVDTNSTGARVVAHAWPAQREVRAVVSAPLAKHGDLKLGDGFGIATGDAQVQVSVAGIMPYLPGTPRGPALLVDRTSLQRVVVEAGGRDPLADGWWIAADDAHAPALTAAVAQALDGAGTTRVAARAEAVAGPLRVGVPAALSLVAGATAALVLVGTGAAAAAAVRSRRLELARLQALGAPRRALVRGLVGEHGILVALGALAGLVIGYLLARVVAPVLTVSPDGRRPVPAPRAAWDHLATLGLTGGLALGACAVVAGLAALLVRRASGALLRLGDDR